jgi:hypothetical protein
MELNPNYVPTWIYNSGTHDNPDIYPLLNVYITMENHHF